ncbi:hypothetical protein ONA24_00225 [Mycoplasmopsis cynos]|nr:hypothetical protein [Mycoplasmopsis cynos]MCU9936024.1 hypothetical protein [Mycoplasmopsis cynos]UWV82896.1 hypothetical protein NW067_01090 [Mycoplasmopsis cynos]WAM03527.1 hypothetical protein ONA22_00340 [Mycoplasmopsis cynos]WAM06649.1 hypothetical protein ONA23_07080 [Mycoplasmopsis cynos]WAM09789.1 hypothetical protein ONA24_00225 [Mycoplasmopsis cynos]
MKFSKEHSLLFDLEILDHQNRTSDIKVNKISRKLFGWFIKYLLFLLENNRYQKGWDYERKNIYGIKI